MQIYPFQFPMSKCAHLSNQCDYNVHAAYLRWTDRRTDKQTHTQTDIENIIKAVCDEGRHSVVAVVVDEIGHGESNSSGSRMR